MSGKHRRRKGRKEREERVRAWLEKNRDVPGFNPFVIDLKATVEVEFIDGKFIGKVVS
jgi:hypothetical protein